MSSQSSETIIENYIYDVIVKVKHTQYKVNLYLDANFLYFNYIQNDNSHDRNSLNVKIRYRDVIYIYITNENDKEDEDENEIERQVLNINFIPKVDNGIICKSLIRKVKHIKVIMMKTNLLHSLYYKILSYTRHSQYSTNNNLSINNSLLNAHPQKIGKFLIFLNPFSGKGEGNSIWESIMSFFNNSFYEYDLIKTTHYRHAYEYISLNFDNNTFLNKKYIGIVCISGDGIVHEVINALMELKKKFNITDKSFLPSVGIIPSGSGNALVKCLLNNILEKDVTIENATHMILTGNRRGLDVIEIKFEGEGMNSQVIYAFLSINFAIIADIDLESDVIRPIGPIRFTIWGLFRLLFLRKYDCSVYILKDSNPNQTDKSSEEDMWEKVDGPFTYFCANNIPFLSTTVNSHPLSKQDDGYIDILLLNDKEKTKLKLMKLLINQDEGDYFEDNDKKIDNIRPNQGIKYYKTKEFRIEVNNITNKNSFFSIDGEKYSFGSVTVKIHPSAIDVFN